MKKLCYFQLNNLSFLSTCESISLCQKWKLLKRWNKKLTCSQKLCKKLYISVDLLLLCSIQNIVSHVISNHSITCFRLKCVSLFENIVFQIIWSNMFENESHHCCCKMYCHGDNGFMRQQIIYLKCEKNTIFSARI